MRMQFSSLYELIDMDGHGVFVWTAVSVSLLIFLILVLLPILSHSRILRNIELGMKTESRSLRNAEVKK
ncbi:MAG: heme exporter protein CcmD [Porticoccaceae bacterium]|jgi:heme exporter protein CcmD|nr:heme exporter protein CcmD [Porticoccaceae bacterium]